MVYDQSPWRSRFDEPSPATLARGLSEPFRGFLATMRQHLKRQPGVSEHVVWYGINWCWSLEYRVRGNTEPLAVIVPSPEDLQIAMPIDMEFVDSLPVTRLKRAVRDGLDLGTDPFDTRWAVWSIQQETIVPDLQDLVGRRHSQLTPAGRRR